MRRWKMARAIKPCPYCGGEAKARRVGRWRLRFSVFCSRCSHGQGGLKMKIHIPAFKAMAKCNEHMDHGPFDIDLGPDVVEVVRCKDCQYYQDAKINKKGFLICPASGMEITETDYCSYGVRMG